MKNYKSFIQINENINFEQIKELQSLNDEYWIENSNYQEMCNELNIIFNKVINSNNSIEIQKIIDFFKTIPISKLQFLFGALYNIKDKKLKVKTDFKMNDYKNELNIIFNKLEKQNLIVKKILKKSDVIIDAAKITNNLTLVRHAIQASDKLPSQQFLYNRLEKLRNIEKYGKNKMQRSDKLKKILKDDD